MVAFMEAILSERILGASAETVDADDSGVLDDSEEDGESEDDDEAELLGVSLSVEDEDFSDDSPFAEEEDFSLSESLSDLVLHDSEGFEKAICQRAGMPLSETTTM
jgi:hypothetical protein